MILTRYRCDRCGKFAKDDRIKDFGDAQVCAECLHNTILEGTA